MNTWKMVYDKFDPEGEHLREALCTLGNGYLGTRGAVQETVTSWAHYPGTYIAGVFNALPTEVSGKTIMNEDFVNCPNWLPLNYRIEDGPWFNRLKVKLLSWKMELNMRKGKLTRRLRWRDDQGRVTWVENQRIVSMADPHMCALRCTIVPENYSGKITIRSGLDGLVQNKGVERYKQLNSKHLEPAGHGSFSDDGIFLTMQTNQSKVQITEALRTLVFHGHERLNPKMSVILHGQERIMHQFTLDVTKGQKYVIEKIVSIYTSRDHGVADHCALAQERVSAVSSFDALLKPHEAKWKALWKRFDIDIEGDDFTQQILRFHTYHLLQVASTYNEEIDAGLPARGLHGEAYRGHIFWDELYSYPFYNLRAPDITRALLMYRYRRLSAAKELAKQNGYRGAMYPWQSASTGEETSQVIHLNPMSGRWGPDYSALQRHVSIAIAYNVWTYYYISGDRDFLERYGAEMLFEIALFWSSLCTHNKKTGRYEIKGVMGPDEFHEKYPGSAQGGLNNNAYTNVMAVWVIEKALSIMERVNPEDLAALTSKTGITEKDVERWKDIIKKMVVPVSKDGLIHQFEGYMDLKELDWDDYRARYENIHRIDRILKAEGLSPDDFKVSKQADVLMLFFVLNTVELKRIFTNLGYSFSKKMMLKNYDYYVQRTSHGSTLSRVVHALVAHKIGYGGQMMQFFRDILESDVRDIQGGTTQEGIHVGVMGASINLFFECFVGLELLDDKICLKPNLPQSWTSVRFHLRYKDIWFDVLITDKKITVKLEPLKEISLQTAREVPIKINNRIVKLTSQKSTTILIADTE